MSVWMLLCLCVCRVSKKVKVEDKKNKRKRPRDSDDEDDDFKVYTIAVMPSSSCQSSSSRASSSSGCGSVWHKAHILYLSAAAGPFNQSGTLYFSVSVCLSVSVCPFFCLCLWSPTCLCVSVCDWRVCVSVYYTSEVCQSTLSYCSAVLTKHVRPSGLRCFAVLLSLALVLGLEVFLRRNFESLALRVSPWFWPTSSWSCKASIFQTYSPFLYSYKSFLLQ